jgi:hypothetical protein
MDESPDYPALAASLTSPAESISEVKKIINLTNRNALFFLVPVDRPMASFASLLKRNCQVGFRLQNFPRGECTAGLYVWATNMIVVQEITHAVARRVAKDLAETGDDERVKGNSPVEAVVDGLWFKA